MDRLIKKNIPDIAALCEKYGVARMHIFGSAVSGNFTQESDVDFLLSFRENLSIKQYTDNFFGIRRALKNLLKRDIDVITERSLSNPYFIENINDTKELIYESENKEIAI